MEQSYKWELKIMDDTELALDAVYSRLWAASAAQYYLSRGQVRPLARAKLSTFFDDRMDEFSDQMRHSHEIACVLEARLQPHGGGTVHPFHWLDGASDISRHPVTLPAVLAAVTRVHPTHLPWFDAECCKERGLDLPNFLKTHIVQVAVAAGRAGIPIPEGAAWIGSSAAAPPASPSASSGDCTVVTCPSSGLCELVPPADAVQAGGAARALALACASGDVAAVRRLLPQMQPNQPMASQYLQLSCEGGHALVALALLDHDDADGYPFTLVGRNALSAALPFPEVVEILLRKAASPDKLIITPAVLLDICSAAARHMSRIDSLLVISRSPACLLLSPEQRSVLAKQLLKILNEVEFEYDGAEPFPVDFSTEAIEACTRVLVELLTLLPPAARTELAQTALPGLCKFMCVQPTPVSFRHQLAKWLDSIDAPSDCHECHAALQTVSAAAATCARGSGIGVGGLMTLLQPVVELMQGDFFQNVLSLVPDAPWKMLPAHEVHVVEADGLRPLAMREQTREYIGRLWLIKSIAAPAAWAAIWRSVFLRSLEEQGPNDGPESGSLTISLLLPPLVDDMNAEPVASTLVQLWSGVRSSVSRFSQWSSRHSVPFSPDRYAAAFADGYTESSAAGAICPANLNTATFSAMLAAAVDSEHPLGRASLLMQSPLLSPAVAAPCAAAAFKRACAGGNAADARFILQYLRTLKGASFGVFLREVLAGALPDITDKRLDVRLKMDFGEHITFEQLLDTSNMLPALGSVFDDPWLGAPTGAASAGEFGAHEQPLAQALGVGRKLAPPAPNGFKYSMWYELHDDDVILRTRLVSIDASEQRAAGVDVRPQPEPAVAVRFNLLPDMQSNRRASTKLISAVSHACMYQPDPEESSEVPKRSADQYVRLRGSVSDALHVPRQLQPSELAVLSDRVAHVVDYMKAPNIGGGAQVASWLCFSICKQIAAAFHRETGVCPHAVGEPLVSFRTRHQVVLSDDQLQRACADPTLGILFGANWSGPVAGGILLGAVEGARTVLVMEMHVECSRILEHWILRCPHLGTPVVDMVPLQPTDILTSEHSSWQITQQLQSVLSNKHRTEAHAGIINILARGMPSVYTRCLDSLGNGGLLSRQALASEAKQVARLLLADQQQHQSAIDICFPGRALLGYPSIEALSVFAWLMPFPDMESLAFFASINASALHTAGPNRQDELLTEHRSERWQVIMQCLDSAREPGEPAFSPEIECLLGSILHIPSQQLHAAGWKDPNAHWSPANVTMFDADITVALLALQLALDIMLPPGHAWVSASAVTVNRWFRREDTSLGEQEDRALRWALAAVLKACHWAGGMVRPRLDWFQLQRAGFDCRGGMAQPTSDLPRVCPLPGASGDRHSPDCLQLCRGRRAMVLHRLAAGRKRQAGQAAAPPKAAKRPRRTGLEAWLGVGQSTV